MRSSARLLSHAWLPEHDVQKCPYKDFGLVHKRAITAALREAWNGLPAVAKKMSIDLWHASEDVFSMLLQNELNRILSDESVSGFTEETFRFVPRGDHVPDYTGKKTQKSPDIVIRPKVFPRGVARRETYGMFVECKLIDRGKPVRLYGQKGIKKFVDGVYAWMMPSAMMLAYVRDGSDPISCLGPHLAKPEFSIEYGKPGSLSITEKALVPPVYVSKHERAFKVGPYSPGDIRLAHVWLRVV